MKVSREELNKPFIKKKDGGFATLKEFLEGNVLVKGDMNSEDFRELSIARYEMMDPGKAIAVGGASYDKNQIINEIRRQTAAGNKLVDLQVSFVRMLLDRKNEIEIA